MQVINTSIPDLLVLEPKVFGDSRGYFFECYNKKVFDQIVPGIEFVQQNESRSSYGVLRGLHFQRPPFAQSKLVRVIEGKVLDVAVDLRIGSETYGKYVSVELSAENKRLFWIPRGFAHGFVVLSETAIFSYLCDNYYSPESDGGVIYNSPELDIDWKLPEKDLLISEKDMMLPVFSSIKCF